MRLLKLFMTFGLFISIIMLVAIIGIDYTLNKSDLEESATNFLIGTTSYNVERTTNYIKERIKDTKVLLADKEIKKVFNVNTWGEVEASKKEIEKITKNIKREVEDYLISNPKKTIEDLQKDEKFLDIIGKKIGKEGYFILIDSDSFVGYMHPEERRINYDYHNYKFDYPEFWKIINRIKLEKEGDGVYSRPELDGAIRDKYAYFVSISALSADNKNLSLIGTVYLDEYLEIDWEKRAVDKIKYFNRHNDYERIIFIDNEGEVLINSGETIVDEYVLNKLFQNIKESTAPQVSEVITPENNTSIIFVSLPYFEIDSYSELGELRGFLLFELSLDKLSQVLYTGTNNNKKIYVNMIDNKGYVISSNDNKKVGEEFSNSIMKRNCIESQENYYKSKAIEEVIFEPKSGKYTNTEGIKFLGASQYIPSPPGCIIVEINYNELFSNYLELSNYLPTLEIFLLLWIVGIICIFIYDRMFELKKRANIK